MNLKQKFFFSVSAVATTLFFSETAAVALGDALDPQAKLSVAAECRITADNGKQTVYFNDTPWDETLAGSVLIKKPSAEAVFESCAQRVLDKDSVGLFSVKRKFWDLVDGDSKMSVLPSGAAPYTYNAYGELVLSNGYLGNKWLAATEAKEIREMGGDVKELSKRYEMQSNSFDNFSRQISDRFKSITPVAWVVNHVL